VRFRKYDDSLHWHATLRRLGEDEHGIWLGAAAGTLGSPWVLLLILGLGLGAGGAWWARRDSTA